MEREQADIQSSGGRGQQQGLAAFGLHLLTDVTPPGRWEERPPSEPLLCLRQVTSHTIDESWSGLDAIGWEGTIDGAPFVVERGVAGDHRFVHGASPDLSQGGDARRERLPATRAVHHLSADGSLLLCAPSCAVDSSWWRVVLDSVLFTAALLQGYEALHAGALATPGGVIAIAATTGGGKSTLLAELLRHGLTLMADDILVLKPAGAGRPPLAYPAPPLMTIPTTRLETLGEAGSPQPIASLAGEHWIPMPVHPHPLPLRALVLLNRSPGLATSMRRAESPLAALLGSLLRFPRTPERERNRFELAGAIAAHVPIWELDADSSVAPEELAGLLLAAVVEPEGLPARSLSAVV